MAKLSGKLLSLAIQSVCANALTGLTIPGRSQLASLGADVCGKLIDDSIQDRLKRARPGQRIANQNLQQLVGDALAELIAGFDTDWHRQADSTPTSTMMPTQHFKKALLFSTTEAD